MKVVVLGLGLSGKSATAFLRNLGHQVVAIDDGKGVCPTFDWEEIDLFVPSPGVPRSHALYREAREHNISIKGEVALALEVAKQPTVGVTGTNGKTTVVQMITHCLNQFRKPAIAVGNVGLPLTQVVSETKSILVIELSSYQLETLQPNVLDVAILLNIAPDHMNRYVDFAEYAQTKKKIAHCMKPDGKCWMHASIGSGDNQFTGDNEEAAFLACSHFGMDRPFFNKAISSFEKPVHRLEFVAKIGGVDFVNDSKATNVAAVEFALGQCSSSCLLLLGGQDKDLDFFPLAKWKHRIKQVIAFGQARGKIADTLKQQLQVQEVMTLQEAVTLAKKLAIAGDIVILSPGCASFDAFENYQARGEAFKRFVKE